MSKLIDDGGQAFPRPYSLEADGVNVTTRLAQEGMSRRDWLAGMALARCLDDTIRWSRQTLKELGFESYEAAAAALAYRAADAMIAEGRKERDDDAH